MNGFYRAEAEYLDPPGPDPELGIYNAAIQALEDRPDHIDAYIPEADQAHVCAKVAEILFSTDPQYAHSTDRVIAARDQYRLYMRMHAERALGGAR